jgi:hypothetical protein
MKSIEQNLTILSTMKRESKIIFTITFSARSFLQQATTLQLTFNKQVAQAPTCDLSPVQEKLQERLITAGLGEKP